MRQTGPVTDTARPAGQPDTTPARRTRTSSPTGSGREDGRVFLSGVQAIARLPVDQLRIDRRNGLDTAAFVSAATRAHRSARSARRSSAPLPHRARSADRHPARRQRGAGRDRGDGQPARRHARRLQATTASSGIWYGKAPGPRPRRRRDPPRACSPARRRHGGVVAVVGDDPSAKSSTLPIVERRHAGRPAHADPVPRRRAGGARPQPPRRRPLACLRHLGRASSSSRRSPTAPARSTCTPTASSPSCPTIEIDGKLLRAAPERAAAHAVHARHGARVPRGAHRAGPPLRRRQPAQPGHGRRTERRLDRHRRLRPHVPRAARGARRARARTRRRPARRRHPAVPAADAGARSIDQQMSATFAHGLAEVLVIEEKNPTLELLVEDALYDVAERPRVVGQARRARRRRSCPVTGMLDADRHARRRCAAASASASATRLATAAAPTPPTSLIPLTGQPHAVLLLGLPAQPEHAGRPRARSSAAASAATRWSP